MSTFLGPFSNDEIQSSSPIKKLNVSRMELDFSSPLGAYNLGENLPINSIVFLNLIRVESVFDGNSTLSIGNNSDPKCYLDENCIDLKEVGVYENISPDLIKSQTQGKAYWNPGSSTRGRLSIVFVYSES